MKLSSAQIQPFLQKPDPRIRVVLIYGPDNGLIRERAEGLAKKTVSDIHDPFRTASLTGAMIADDPARLSDEMATQSLGGGLRLIRIQGVGEAITAPLDALLKNMPPSDSLMIIEAGDLDKRSKLRALCENEELAVAIPCYVEEGAARTRIISDILQAENLRITREALSLLTDVLPPDRMAMRSELEKLALYVRRPDSTSQAPSPITIENVKAIVQDAGAAELDDLIFAVGQGDVRRVGLLIHRLLEEQTSTVAILRTAQRHFLRLQWARQQMDLGLSPTEAIKRLQPPVFWKYQESMTQQVRRWSRVKIEAALGRLYEAEAMVKRTGTPDQTLCAQLLLGLAS